MRRNVRTRRGVALVEILLAAAILAVCVVPITGTISYMRTNAAQAEVETQVMSGMQTTIGNILDGGKLSALVATVVPVASTVTLPGGTWVSYSTTITAVSGYKKLYAITCTATWLAPGTSNRVDSTTLTAYALSS